MQPKFISKLPLKLMFQMYVKAGLYLHIKHCGKYESPPLQQFQQCHKAICHSCEKKKTDLHFYALETTQAISGSWKKFSIEFLSIL